MAEDGESEDAHAAVEFAWDLALRAGHNLSMTIELKSSGKDKTQILQITARQCEAQTKLTPLTLCTEIQKRIMPMAEDKMTVPVKTSKVVPMLRKAAKDIRTELLG